MLTVRESINPKEKSQQAHSRAHGHTALSVFCVPEDIHCEKHTSGPLEYTQWGSAIQMPLLWHGFQAQICPQKAFNLSPWQKQWWKTTQAWSGKAKPTVTRTTPCYVSCISFCWASLSTEMQHLSYCISTPIFRSYFWSTYTCYDFTFTFHFHALEKEMATHSSVLACRIRGMGEPGGLPSMGSHRVRQDWRDLAEQQQPKHWRQWCV